MTPRRGDSDYDGPRIQTHFGPRPAIYLPLTPQLAGGKRGTYVFERHRVPAGSLPEHSFDGHMLLLPMGRRSISFESRLNGKHVTGSIAPRHFRFLAAGDTLSTAWDGPMDSILFSINPQVLKRLFSFDSAAPTLDFVSRIHPHEDPVLMHLTLTMHSHLETGGQAGEIFEHSLLGAIAARLVRRYAHGRYTAERRDPLPRWKRARIEDYVRSNLAGRLTLSSLASMVELSPHQLCRTYRATTGQSLWQFVLESRAKAALGLITRRPMVPLAVVASDVGFESYSQFIAAFRKFFGQLPSEYRRSLNR